MNKPLLAIHLDPTLIEQLNRYAHWPAWRRWVWRNLGR